jgi:hypothetical protein
MSKLTAKVSVGLTLAAPAKCLLKPSTSVTKTQSVDNRNLRPRKKLWETRLSRE